MAVNRLGHGHWRAWLLTQWPLDPSLANRRMNVARKCGPFPHLKIPRSILYLLAADSTPDTLRDDFLRRVEAGGPPRTHADLKAEIELRRPEPATAGNQAAPKAAAPSLREEILACLDQAASLLNGKHAAALKALESARSLVVGLNE